MSRWLVLAPLALIACKKEAAPPKGEPAAANKVAQESAKDGANAAAANPACAKAKPRGALSWIYDDLPAALACAKARDVPIVIDLWAPWCHTCLSMESTVFTDKSLAGMAPKFVFAALDTDRDANAAAVAKYPPAAWPTFYVIGPDEAVLARFVGAASLEQFQAFLDAGARARAGGAAGADAHLLSAERALTLKKLDVAEQELTAALAAAPAGWARRPDALVSLISTKRKRGDLPGCMELAEKAIGETGSTASATDFLYSALTCAHDALEAAPKDRALAARVQKLREAAIARLSALVADPAAPMSVDDRSDAMVNLREALEAVGKKDEARATAEKQLALLDETAAKAPTPIAAMTYNWPRAEVYVYLGRALDLVPALEKSVKDLPHEYDPPARLGWVLWKGGKLEEAAKWMDVARGLVYGPRKVRVLTHRAEISAALGDKAAERAAREDIVKTLEALPEGQTTPEALEKAKQTLAELDAKPAAGKPGDGKTAAKPKQ